MFAGTQASEDSARATLNIARYIAEVTKAIMPELRESRSLHFCLSAAPPNSSYEMRRHEMTTRNLANVRSAVLLHISNHVRGAIWANGEFLTKNVGKSAHFLLTGKAS